MKKPSILIIGAGVAGLSAAWGLSQKGYKVTIVEKGDHLGGMSTTFKWGKYSLDLGPHKFYTIIPGVLQKMKKLLGSEFVSRPKTSKIFLFNSYLEYPIKIVNLVKKMGPVNAVNFAFDYGSAQLINYITHRQPKNSEEYLRFFYGNTAYKKVFEPLANKIWGKPKLLDASLAKTRVPAPTIFQLISGMIFGTKNQPTVSADVFYYPKKGIGELSKAMLKASQKNGAKIFYQTYPTKIKIKNNRIESVVLSNKEILNPDYVISSTHLSHLVSLISPKIPIDIQKAANSLKHRSLILIYLAFNKKRLFKDSWMFFPESNFIFNRLSEQKAFSESMIPQNHTVLVAEITCEFGDARWNSSPEKIVKKVVSDLKRANLIKSDENQLDSHLIKVGHGYPVYSLGYEENKGKILDYLSKINGLYTIGRPGLFFYNNMDHSIDIGQQLSNHIAKNGRSDVWRQQLEEFFKSKIVD